MIRPLALSRFPGNADNGWRPTEKETSAIRQRQLRSQQGATRLAFPELGPPKDPRRERAREPPFSKDPNGPRARSHARHEVQQQHAQLVQRQV